MHKYTLEQRKFIEENCKGKTNQELTDLVNAYFGINLRKTQISAYKKNHNLKSGMDFKMKPGQVSWNKGKKMSAEQYERCKATMFKKGNVPKNTYPIGTEVEMKGGYLIVKVDDKPKAPKWDNWKMKHHLVWEKANGPVPEGCRVIFKDGDPSNCDLSNLGLLTKAEHILANLNGLRNTDPKITETGMVVAKVLGKMSEIRKAEE